MLSRCTIQELNTTHHRRNKHSHFKTRKRIMSKLTKEQYDLLHEKYSVAIMWAIKSNCVPAFSRSELEELKAIYMWLGHKLEDSHCGHCLLAMMQTIGKEYFEFEALLPKVKVSENKKVKEVKDEREASTDSSSDEHEECGVHEGCSDPGADGEEAGHEAETEEGAEDDSEKAAPRRSRRRSNSKSNV